MPGASLPLAACSGHPHSSGSRFKDYFRSHLSKPQYAGLLSFLRAYLLGFGIDVIPALLKRLVIQLIKLARRRKSSFVFPGRSGISKGSVEASKIILSGFRLNGLAMACGVAIGGARMGEGILRPCIEQVIRPSRPVRRKLQKWLAKRKSPCDNSNAGNAVEESIGQGWTEGELRAINCITTFCSASLSSLISIQLLQGNASSPKLSHSTLHPATTPRPVFMDGRDTSFITASRRATVVPSRSKSRQSPTLDLTLFFAVRAMDTIVRATYTNCAPRYLSFLGNYSEAILFQLCCWRIMWCWFYEPRRLPLTYVKWISKLSAMDPRLLQLIRAGRAGHFSYGVKTTEEISNLGRSIAEQLGKPPELGDPELIRKFPCEIAHGRVGDSERCTINALRRWRKAWLQAIGIYLPVFAVPALLLNRSRLIESPLTMSSRVLLNSIRSASFLSIFISLTWFGTCIGRSDMMRSLLELILGRALPTIYMDSTFAPQFGSFLSGSSILIENSKRRGEMTLYVGMRALCCSIDLIIPRALWNKIQSNKRMAIWVERTVFSFSLGTVISAVVHRPEYVRGIVKGIVQFTVEPNRPIRSLSLPPPPATPVRHPSAVLAKSQCPMKDELKLVREDHLSHRYYRSDEEDEYGDSDSYELSPSNDQVTFIKIEQDSRINSSNISLPPNLNQPEYANKMHPPSY